MKNAIRIPCLIGVIFGVSVSSQGAIQEIFPEYSYELGPERSCSEFKSTIETNLAGFQTNLEAVRCTDADPHQAFLKWSNKPGLEVKFFQDPVHQYYYPHSLSECQNDFWKSSNQFKAA